MKYSELKLIGTDCDKYNILFGDRYVSSTYLVPKATDPRYIDILNKIINKEKVNLIIPSPDVEIKIISKYRSRLKALSYLPNSKVIELAQDKLALYEKIHRVVRMPKTILINNKEDLVGAFKELGRPLWLRKRIGSGGAASILVDNIKYALLWVSYWNGFGEFIANEYLPGRNLSWIGLYKDGKLFTSGAYLRIRYFMSHVSVSGVTGNINVGMTIHDNKVNEVAEKAIKALDDHPVGVFTVDLKEDKNGFPKVTEINAGRLHMSAYVYTVAGLNIPYYIVKLALNEDIENPPPRRNAVRPGMITVRSTDNDPVFIDKSELNKRFRN
jgi:carbamoyl-phosphate synthase large subunit